MDADTRVQLDDWPFQGPFEIRDGVPPDLLCEAYLDAKFWLDGARLDIHVDGDWTGRVDIVIRGYQVVAEVWEAGSDMIHGKPTHVIPLGTATVLEGGEDPPDDQKSSEDDL